MKIFDWRYAFYNAREIAVLFVILAISVFFTGLGQLSLTVFGISVVVYLFINRRWKEPFRQAHPTFDPAKRKASHWGWRIVMLLLLSVLILFLQRVVPIVSRVYLPTLLLVIFIASFIQDGFTQPKPEPSHSSGSQKS